MCIYTYIYTYILNSLKFYIDIDLIQFRQQLCSEFVFFHSEHNRRAEDKETYQNWVKTMEPIYNNVFDFTRVSPRCFSRSFKSSHLVTFLTLNYVFRLLAFVLRENPLRPTPR